MALVSGIIPNLVGGVSQQAPAARPKNTSKYELNTRHSLVSGLTKRPATDYIAEVASDIDSSVGAASHAFETANGKRFMLTLDQDVSNNPRCTVVNAEDGTKYEVGLGPVSAYFDNLPASMSSGFKFLTIGDTTFILNTAVAPIEVPVQEDNTAVATTDLTVANVASLPSVTSYAAGTTAYAQAEESYHVIKTVNLGDSIVKYWSIYTPINTGNRIAPERRASVYIRQAVHNTEYKVVVKFADLTSATFSYTTPDPVTGETPNPIDTGLICSNLSTSIGANTFLTASRIGSTITITSSKDIESIEVTDEFGDQASRGYTDAVQSFSDLPPNEVEGRVVRISGSVDTGQDDYYVEHENGLWRETVKFGDKTVLNNTTMPVTLVYDPSGDTFTISYHTWPGRDAGDVESNPSPTFVGRTVNDMFLFKGRMCFLSDENVIFSEVGRYENFYRTTLTLLLETDRIDIASTASRTSILRHGVAFDETLVLFSDSQQFRILSGNSLTPQNVSIVPTTTFNASLTCRPIAVGPNVFFSEDSSSGSYGSVMEYYRNPNTERDDAASVSASVPRYLPKDIIKLTSAFNENIVIALPENNAGKLFVHSYFWSGGEKVASSWTTWQIRNVQNIVAADFFGDILYMIVEDKNNRVQLISCDVEEGRIDTGLEYLFHLDQRAFNSGLTIAYDGATDRTSYTLPYTLGAGEVAQVFATAQSGEYEAGTELAQESSSATTVFVNGDTSAVPVVMGIKYSFIYDFSPQYVRGSDNVVRQNGRLSLRHMNLRFDNTSYFNVEVTPTGRATWTAVHPGDFYTAKILQTQEGQTDLAPVEPGEFRFACNGKSDEVNIRIVNDTPYPCAFTQAEWEAQYSPKTRFI